MSVCFAVPADQALGLARPARRERGLAGDPVGAREVDGEVRRVNGVAARLVAGVRALPGIELDLWIGGEQRLKVAALFPDAHGVALHGAIGVLAAHAGLRQGQQHTLRVVQPAELVEITLHRFRVDEQAID